MIHILIGSREETQRWIRNEKKNGHAVRYVAVKGFGGCQIMLVWPGTEENSLSSEGSEERESMSTAKDG